MDTYGQRLYAALAERKPELVREKKEREWLAGKIGVTVQALGQVINGKTRELKAPNHELAVAELGCSGMWLAHGIGEMFPSTLNAWPFPLITPSQYQQLDAEFRRHIENNVAGEWMRLQQNKGLGT